MADLDRDFGLTGLGGRRNRVQAESAAPDIEVPTAADMLIVGAAGVLSASIAALGIWKFVELVV